MATKPHLNTLLAIICVALIAFVGIFTVAMYSLNGEALKFIIGLAIFAIAGLGGYEIRQMKE